MATKKVISPSTATTYPPEGLSVLSLSTSKVMNMSNQDTVHNRIRKGAQIRLIETMIKLQTELAKASQQGDGDDDLATTLMITKGSDLTVLSSLVRDLVKHVPAAYMGGIYYPSFTSPSSSSSSFSTNASVTSRSTSPSTGTNRYPNGSSNNNTSANGLISVTVQLWEIIVNLLYGPVAGAEVDYGYTEMEVSSSISNATNTNSNYNNNNFVTVFDPPTTLLYDIILFIKSILTADPYMFSTVPALQPFGYAIMRALTATTAVPLGARTTRPGSTPAPNGTIRIQVPFTPDSLLPGTLRVEVYSALGCITGSLGMNTLTTNNDNMYNNNHAISSSGLPLSRPQSGMVMGNAHPRPVSALTSSTIRNTSTTNPHHPTALHNKALASPRPWEEGAVHHDRNFRTYVSLSPERPLSAGTMHNEPPKDGNNTVTKPTVLKVNPSTAVPTTSTTVKLSTKFTSPFAQKLRRRTAAATGRSVSNSRHSDSSASSGGSSQAHGVSSRDSTNATTANQITVMYDIAKQILMNAGVASHVADAGITLHNLGFVEWTPHMGSSIARSMDRNPGNGSYVFVNGQAVNNRVEKDADNWKRPESNANYRSASNLVGGKPNPNNTILSTNDPVYEGNGNDSTDEQTRALYADYEVAAGPDENEMRTAPEGSTASGNYAEAVRSSLQLNVMDNSTSNCTSSDNNSNAPTNLRSVSTVLSGSTTVNSAYPGRAPEWFPLPSSSTNPSSSTPTKVVSPGKTNPTMTNSVVNSTGKLVRHISRAKGTVANRNAYRNEEAEGLSAWMTNMGDMAEEEAEEQRQARANKYLYSEVDDTENTFLQLGNYAEEEAEVQRQSRAMKYLTAAVEQEDITLSTFGLLAENEANEEREARAAKNRSGTVDEEKTALNALSMFTTDEAEKERAKRITGFIQSATSEEETILATTGGNGTGTAATATAGTDANVATTVTATATPTKTGPTGSTEGAKANKLASMFKVKMNAENLAKDRLPKLRAMLQERKSKAKALAEAAAAAAKAVKEARQRAQKITDDEKAKTVTNNEGKENNTNNPTLPETTTPSTPEVIQAQANVLATEIEAAAMMRAANLAIKAVEETAVELTSITGDKDTTIAAVHEILPVATVPPSNPTVDTAAPSDKESSVENSTNAVVNPPDDSKERAERCRQYLDALQKDEDETLLALAAYANADNDVTTEASTRITVFLKAEKDDKQDNDNKGSTNDTSSVTSPSASVVSPSSPVSSPVATVKSPSKGLMSFATSVFTRMRITKITRNQLPRLRAQLAAKKLRALALSQAAAAAALAQREAKAKAEEAKAQVQALTQSIEQATLNSSNGNEPSSSEASTSSLSSLTIEQQQEELKVAEALVTVHETSARIAEAEVNAFMKAADNAITEVKLVNNQIATEMENNPSTANVGDEAGTK